MHRDYTNRIEKAMRALPDRIVMTKTQCYEGSAEVALIFNSLMVEHVHAGLVYSSSIPVTSLAGAQVQMLGTIDLRQDWWD